MPSPKMAKPSENLTSKVVELSHRRPDGNRSEVELVTERVEQTKMEIEHLKSELQKLINSGIKKDVLDDVHLETKIDVNEDNVGFDNFSENKITLPSESHLSEQSKDKSCLPLKLTNTKTSGKTGQVTNRSRKQLSPIKGLPSNITVRKSTSMLEKHQLPIAEQEVKETCRKVRHYNKEEAQEYIKNQKEKRKLMLQTKIKETQNMVDLKKEKLRELHKKSLLIVTKSINWKRERSRSRNRNEEDNPDNVAHQVAQTKFRPARSRNRNEENDLDNVAQAKFRPAQKVTISDQSVPEHISSNQAAVAVNKTQSVETIVKSDQLHASPTENLNFHPQMKNITIRSSEINTNSIPNLDVSFGQNFECHDKTQNAAAIKIQSAFRRYRQQKQKSLRKQKNVTNVTKETQTSPGGKLVNCRRKIWLQTPTSFPYPYNFINTVKRKLNIVTQNDPTFGSVDIGIQNSPTEPTKTYSEESFQTKTETTQKEDNLNKSTESTKSNRNATLKSFLSDKCLDLDLRSVEPLTLKSSMKTNNEQAKVPISNKHSTGSHVNGSISNRNIQGPRKKFDTSKPCTENKLNCESDSDTSKNIPEICSETESIHSPVKKLNLTNNSDGFELQINSDKIKDMRLHMRYDVFKDKNVYYQDSNGTIPSLKTDTKILVKDKADMQNTNNCASQMKNTNNCASQMKNTNNCASQMKNTNNRASQEEISEHIFANQEIESEVGNKFLRNGSQNSSVQTTTHSKPAKISDPSKLNTSSKFSGHDTIIAFNKTPYSTVVSPLFDKHQTNNHSESHTVLTNSSKTNNTAAVISNGITSVKNVNSHSIRSQSQSKTSDSSVKSRKQKSSESVPSVIDLTATATTIASVDSGTFGQSDQNSSENGQEVVSRIRSSKVSEKSNVYSSDYTSVSASSLSSVPSLKHPSISLQRSSRISKSTANQVSAMKRASFTLQPPKTSLTENKPSSNEIHLKFEAQLHFLNDFNESLQNVMTLEKSLLQLKDYQMNNAGGAATLPQNKNTQTSLLTKSSIETQLENSDVVQDISTRKTSQTQVSSINYSRGSEVSDNCLDATILNDNTTITSIDEQSLITGFELSQIQNSLDASVVESNVDISISIKDHFNSQLPPGVSLGVFEQLIKDEDARIESLKTVLKIREKALLDRTKGELAWLEIRKKQYRELGQLQEIPNVKKRQRGLLLKLQHERHEMQRLKQMQKAASKERKTILKEQRNMIKEQLSTNNMIAKIKRNTNEKRHSGPLKVYNFQSCQGSIKSETSISRKSSITEEVVSIVSQSVVDRFSEEVQSEVSVQEIKNNSAVLKTNIVRTEHVKRTLLMREAALQKRRKAAEELLQWHQRLLDEEKKIYELECAANSIINQAPNAVKTSESNDTPSEKFAFTGAQLNLLWRNMTGRDEQKFNDRESYMMSKRAFERFYRDAKKCAMKNNRFRSSANGSVSDNSFSVAKTDREIINKANSTTELLHNGVQSSSSLKLSATSSSDETYEKTLQSKTSQNSVIETEVATNASSSDIVPDVQTDKIVTKDSVSTYISDFESPSSLHSSVDHHTPNFMKQDSEVIVQSESNISSLDNSTTSSKHSKSPRTVSQINGIPDDTESDCTKTNLVQTEQHTDCETYSSNRNSKLGTSDQTSLKVSLESESANKEESESANKEELESAEKKESESAEREESKSAEREEAKSAEKEELQSSEKEELESAENEELESSEKEESESADKDESDTKGSKNINTTSQLQSKNAASNSLREAVSTEEEEYLSTEELPGSIQASNSASTSVSTEYSCKIKNTDTSYEHIQRLNPAQTEVKKSKRDSNDKNVNDELELSNDKSNLEKIQDNYHQNNNDLSEYVHSKGISHVQEETRITTKDEKLHQLLDDVNESEKDDGSDVISNADTTITSKELLSFDPASKDSGSRVLLGNEDEVSVISDNQINNKKDSSKISNESVKTMGNDSSDVKGEKFSKTSISESTEESDNDQMSSISEQHIMESNNKHSKVEETVVEKEQDTYSTCESDENSNKSSSRILDLSYGIVGCASSRRSDENSSETVSQTLKSDNDVSSKINDENSNVDNKKSVKCLNLSTPIEKQNKMPDSTIRDLVSDDNRVSEERSVSDKSKLCHSGRDNEISTDVNEGIFANIVGSEAVKTSMNDDDESVKTLMNEDNESVKTVTNEDNKSIKTIMNEDELLKTLMNEDNESVKTVTNEDNKSITTLMNEDNESVKTVTNEDNKSIKTLMNEDNESVKIVMNEHNKSIKIIMNEDNDLFKTLMNEDNESVKTIMNEHNKSIKIIMNEDELLKTLMNEDNESVKTVMNEDNKSIKIIINEDNESVKTVINEDNESVKTVMNEDNESVKTVMNEDNESVKTIMNDDSGTSKHKSPNDHCVDEQVSVPSVSEEFSDSLNNSHNNVDVKKRVLEILADVKTVKGDKSTRLQDFYITTYDVISPEHSPELGSPIDEQTAEPNYSSPKSMYVIDEAEELFKKQLAIEKEIKEIQQQQKGQLPYLYIREIPNKPPPPYTPPIVIQTPAVSSVLPCNLEQIHKIAPAISKILYDASCNNNIDNVAISKESSIRKDIDKDCFEFVVDLCKESAKNYYQQFEDDLGPSWLKLSKKAKLAIGKPFDEKGLEAHINRTVQELVGYQTADSNKNTMLKWSHKKRDHVDELLVLESQAEEAEWTNYDKDELIVKDVLTNDIMNMLLTETSQIANDILSRKSYLY